jgi:D-alanine--poly(phosphoribitol) ligase subunit 1
MHRHFYKKIYSNLNSNKIFYTYNNIQYKYSDIKKIYEGLLGLLSNLKNTKKKSGKIIFVISNKSFEFYALSISIILSGNIWVPLSPRAPIKLIKKNIDILKPEIIFFDKKNILEQNTILRYIKKNKINHEIIENIYKYRKTKKISKTSFVIKQNNTAMIFFTSGSTGEGKAVPISHKNYITCLKSQIKNIYKTEKKLVFGDFHESSFVIILVILFPCLYTKSTICPAIEKADILFPLNHINKNKINTLVTVPSYLHQIKNNFKNKVKFKILILCGEPFYLDLLNFIINKKIAHNTYNCYGSTEVSPWVFFHRCKKSDLLKFKKLGLVPVGKKFNFVKTKIINEELYVAGDSLVNGYLNKKLNNEKFFNISGRQYFKTGDIIKKISGISIIKGRNDRVAKILGHRVDITEIELVLKKIINFKNCFVFVQNISEYEKIICAAIESSSYKEPFIKKKLKENLPSYMIPKKIIFLKKFPLNKNFKMDRLKISELFYQ